MFSGGSKSRNKVSVGEPAEGSLQIPILREYATGTACVQSLVNRMCFRGAPSVPRVGKAVNGRSAREAPSGPEGVFFMCECAGL